MVKACWLKCFQTVPDFRESYRINRACKLVLQIGWWDWLKPVHRTDQLVSLQSPAREYTCSVYTTAVYVSSEWVPRFSQPANLSKVSWTGGESEQDEWETESQWVQEHIRRWLIRIAFMEHIKKDPKTFRFHTMSNIHWHLTIGICMNSNKACKGQACMYNSIVGLFLTFTLYSHLC